MEKSYSSKKVKSPGIEKIDKKIVNKKGIKKLNLRLKKKKIRGLPSPIKKYRSRLARRARIKLRRVD